MIVDAMKRVVEALEYHQAQTRPIGKTQDAIALGRQAIEAAQSQEPDFYAHDGQLMTPARAKFLGFPTDSILALYTYPQAKAKQEQIDLWRTDAPPKRGAYQVKRVGEASTQRGFSYWNGERWGAIFSRRSFAQEYKDTLRNRASKYPMEWLQKVTKP